MCRITFSQESVKQLKVELRKAYERGDLRAVRRLSVLVMVGERMSLTSILSVWNVSVQTVYNWMKEFVQERWQSLEIGKAPGRPPRLTKRQKRQLSAWIEAGPEACGYPTGCWTSLFVQDLIYRKFHVLYNRFYVCELLHRLGFSRQKARFVSDHLDAAARQRWVEQEWPKILAQAKKLGAPPFFEDEASFALWGSLSYTWALVGQQPLVKTTGKGKGYKGFGAIEFFTGRLVYQGLEERFTSQTYQTFLLYLLSQNSGPVILIQDGAKYHTSKATQEFIQQHHDCLLVYQLPSYSPDFNPIEFLWKKIKTLATHNRYFEEFVKLVKTVDEALQFLASQPDEIERLMGFYTDEIAKLTMP
ncbi:MAG TPA: IS630 family transposase [Anaerolineales bacterium]|nr:IS630 family transposase [Anaerolineales bacterium]